MDLRQTLAQVETTLPLLLQSPDLWSTVDVDYEPPRVERVWIQLGPVRVYLHRIHPCKQALMHPHPWPSIVKVISGEYEMGVSYGSTSHGAPVPTPAAIIRLVAGSSYEMSDPNGWHYVKPIGFPSLSLMITGAPWESSGRHTPGKGIEFKQLSESAKLQIMRSFQQEYSVLVHESED